MSPYYHYKFTSPEGIYATIKEELRSYFEAGIVDDTMFPVWTDKCLKKLGKAAYEVNEALLNIQGYKATLPDDFVSSREAWACNEFTQSTQLPSAIYNQAILSTCTRLDTPDLYCQKCDECQFPDMIEAVYKTTHRVAFTVRRERLLIPGNITPDCEDNNLWYNKGWKGCDTYDIRDNKFVVDFKEGIVHFQYYSQNFDKDNNQLIPDDYRVMEYIEAFIKQKIFEQVFNQTTDETFNQSQAKYALYKQMADEAYILADTENKNMDVYRRQRFNARIKNRFNRYNIN